MSILSDIEGVLSADAAKDIWPVLLGDLQGLAADPELILNPLTQPAEIAKLEGDLIGALPTFEKDSVGDLLKLVVTYITKVKIPAAMAMVAARKAAAKPA